MVLDFEGSFFIILFGVISGECLLYRKLIILRNRKDKSVSFLYILRQCIIPVIFVRSVKILPSLTFRIFGISHSPFFRELLFGIELSKAEPNDQRYKLLCFQLQVFDD